ncbi:hypothetical protein [Chamaesiphon sp.]|uniref:hypothetical protein n=1 Tax=Chamaesiphon sp. TaxID=2814140 RepID=UPI00359406A8
MEYWEFLIQRQGDRGWRPIKTGNLQLMEGKYRIVANSNLLDTQIQTRVTYQTPGVTPQRRSQSCNQTTKSNGLLVIIPFTQLHSGIWQFVCSGTTTSQTAWHQILKLRVLPRTPAPVAANDPLQLETLPSHSHRVGTGEELATPTQPMVPISMLGEQENWADGLDRLLEQLERDSLKVHHQPPVSPEFPGTIQLQQIVDPPLQLIGLNRATFSGIVPGNRLTIAGVCNLQLLSANLIHSVKVEKLSICLRHPQTSEIITAIEQTLPPSLDTFSFSGQLQLPTEPKISLLLGEVSLYDKHHIQLGSSGFTVTLNLNPLHESELSLLRMFDLGTDPAAVTLTQLTQELQREIVTIDRHGSTVRPPAPSVPSSIPSLNSPHYPSVPLAYRRASVFAHPDIVPVEPSTPHHLPHPKLGTTPTAPTAVSGDLDLDLDLDFANPTAVGAIYRHQDLEIVVDD